jgi:hypothetical protein
MTNQYLSAGDSGVEMLVKPLFDGIGVGYQ